MLACAGAILLWLAFVSAVLSPLWPALAWLAFGVLVVLHARLFQRIDRARNAERWYERGLNRLAGRWAGNGRDGTVFLEGHSLRDDLDLFGRASLFELINTARTGAGETTLAEWLRAGAPVEEIRARQAGVAELRPMLDFREDVAVLADESAIGRTGPLASWAAAAPARFSRTMRVALPVLAAVTAASARWLTASASAPPCCCSGSAASRSFSGCGGAVSRPPSTRSRRPSAIWRSCCRCSSASSGSRSPRRA